MTRRSWLRPRALLVLICFLSLGGAWAPAENRPPLEERLRKDITFLASDQCEGRGLSTKGINLAGDYIADQFKNAGLKPAGKDGSYFQPFEVLGQGKLDKPNHLEFHGPNGKTLTLKIGEDFQVMGLSGTGKLTAPVVFAGYGVTAPEKHYDDYGKLDVEGKVVVLVRKTPRFKEDGAPANENMRAQRAALVTKMVTADLHKAAAVVLVNDRDREDDRLMNFSYSSRGSGASKLPAVHVRRSVIDTLLKSCLNTTVEALEKDIDKDLKPRSALITGWTASVQTTVKRENQPARNVIGWLEGFGPLAKETVVIGAHYDHLGYGGRGSLAKDRNKKEIHPGADDNGSGTTMLMELARRFAQQEKRTGRRLVFIAFSGEETGLLGSEHYCNNPLFALADTVAMVNLDMVGRLRQDDKTRKDKLEIEGTGTAPPFAEWLDTLNQKYQFKLVKQAGGMGPSDHASFYRKKIPVCFFYTGSHRDYHRPSDTAEKINVPGMVRIASLVQEMVTKLTLVPERPKYVYVRSTRSSGRGSSGPRLRFMPDSYSEEDSQDGVLIGDVIEDGPAAKAGIKKGDRIVELAGKPVKNLQAFMVLMRSQKKGEAVEVGILRDGKKMTVKAVPE